MSKNSPFYSLFNSVFTKPLINDKDKTGASRDGSAKRGLYYLTGNLRIYTLECNYNIAHQTNPVPYIDLDEKYEEDNV